MVTIKDRRHAIRLAFGVLFALALFVLVSRWKVAGKQEPTPINVQAVVDQLYPQTLVDQADPEGSGGVPLSRKSCFVVFDTFSDGTPQTIIAAYSNASEAAIRVLRAGPDRTYAVVYEPADLSPGGINCLEELVDVEADGAKEVLIALQSCSSSSLILRARTSFG